jgi:hypothetical protein
MDTMTVGSARYGVSLGRMDYGRRVGIVIRCWPHWWSWSFPWPVKRHG